MKKNIKAKRIKPRTNKIRGIFYLTFASELIVACLAVNPHVLSQFQPFVSANINRLMRVFWSKTPVMGI